MVDKTQAFIRSNLNWIGVDSLDHATASENDGLSARRVRILDYACGPGTVTTVLQGHATEIIGIDLSENMVKAYNQTFVESDQHDVTVSRAPKAFVGDLLDAKGPSESISSSEFFNFDLVVVGYGFHHFEDLDMAASRLASRLKPGGVLLIVDFLPHAKFEAGNPAKNTVAHHGFGEEDVKVIFGRAGLVDVEIREMEGFIELKRRDAGDDVPGEKRRVFLGRGTKPA